MRIALFTEVFRPKVDGITNTLVHTLEHLRGCGDEVLIFAPESSVESFLGYRVVRLKGVKFPPYPELSFTFPSPRMVWELWKFRPDVVHVVGPAVLGVWGVFASRFLGYPTITSYHTDYHNYMPLYKLGALVRFLSPAFRLVFNRAQLNLCPSSHTRDDLVGQGVRNVGLWRGGVDSARFHPGNRSEEFRRMVGCRPGEVLAMYVGRLAPEKSIEQMKYLSERYPQIQTVLVGSGPAGDHLRKVFDGKRCFFTGHLEGDALATAFASADFFVMPSKTETFGLVTLEAMSSGLPVLAADAGGTKDLIRNEHNGLLYPPDDIESMLAGAKRLIESAELRERLAQQGREMARNATWSAETDRLRALYLRTAEAIDSAQVGSTTMAS